MMRPRQRPPKGALVAGIGRAKELVREHVDPNVPAGDRLRDIAKALNVSRIEPGAVRSEGFLKRLPDDSFAIYYAANCSLERRRFTVAHELAHLVLEKSFKHIGRDHTGSAANGGRAAIERTVDRIAAELLMPEHLVVDLIATECQIQCKRSEPRAQKRQVLRAVGKTLGVSEYALVMRILELPALLAVLFRAQWNSNGVPSQVRLSPAVCTKHSRVEVVNGEYLDPGIIENADEWVHSAEMQTTWGRRLVHCYAWRRPALLKEQGDTETWALGWTWNTNPIPSWDDSLETAETIRAIPRSLASRAAF